MVKQRIDYITGSPGTQTRHIPGYKEPWGDLTLNGYDHEVTKWLRSGRKGPKPSRRVEKS